MTTQTSLEELSTGDVSGIDGTGIFDKLMRASESHLQREFESGRIVGKEYSNVYLGIVQSVLSQATQFVLSAKLTDVQIDEANERIAASQAATVIAQAQSAKDLLVKDAQIAKLEVEKLNTEADTLRINNVTAQVAQETLKAASQTTLIDKQVLQTEQETLRIISQTNLIDKQALQTVADTDNTIAETAKSESQKALIDKQVLKTAQEITLTVEQIEKTVKESNLLVVQYNKILQDIRTGTEQEKKLVAETGLINQKALTEEAEIKDIVDGGITVTGKAGRQYNLIEAQARGFGSKSDLDTVKVLVDMWNVARTTDKNATALPPVVATTINDYLLELLAKQDFNGIATDENP